MSETTQDSLNVRLAKWAGWRATWDGETWRLFSPEGCVKYMATIEDEAAFWKRACLQNNLDYEHDLNAGMALLDGKYQVTLNPEYDYKGGGWTGEWGVVIRTITSRTVWEGYGDTPTQALAHALDAMRQQQERPDAT